MRLHVEIIRGRQAEAGTQAVAFLHGILGAGVNLKSLARQCVDALPRLTVVLVDLRAHGRSTAHEGVDDISSTADDVVAVFRELQLELTDVVGHSFGGKVALALIDRSPTLRCVVTLDSAPGLRLDERGSVATTRVLSLLESLHGPWPSRDAFTRALRERGETPATAQWLAMNLVQRTDGFHFGRELPRIRSLLKSYFEFDAWPIIERAVLAQHSPTSLQVYLVAASASTVYDEAEQQRAELVARSSGDRLHFVVLEGGHWLHVDNPTDVLSLLMRALASNLQ